MKNMTDDPERVKGGVVSAFSPEDEATLLATCAAVFGDGTAIRLDPIERHVAAAREALRRACEVSPASVTDWRAEAAREVALASGALDAIPPADLGRVPRAAVAGLRDDLAEIMAVLKGAR